MSNSLPTKADFFANNLDDIDTCSICMEAFDEKHIPARIRGQGQCRHIFGKDCLKEWLEENTNCPICREELFVKGPPPKPFCICQVTNVEHAWDFIYMLRRYCIDDQRDFPIDDNENGEAIALLMQALFCLYDRYLDDFPTGLTMKARHDAAVVPIVKQMMLLTPKDLSDAAMQDRTRNADFFGMMSNALGWNFPPTPAS